LYPLAVIPIVVNAGAVVLPAILGGLASVIALLFRPGELARALRRRPWIPLLAVALLLLTRFAWVRVRAASSAARRSPAAAAPHADGIDWAGIALDIIQEREREAAIGSSSLVHGAGPEPRRSTDTGFRFDATRSGYLGGPSPTTLVPLWEYAADDTMYLSSPLVRGDRIYGASCYLDPPGSYGEVFCLDAATGEEIWSTDMKSADAEFKGFFSSAALTSDGESLVIGQGLHADTGCELVCLDAKTGRVRWLAPTPLHIEGSPAIAGDIVVAGAGAVERGASHKPRGNPDKEGHPGFVFAVRISDGHVLWRYDLVDPESSPAIRDGVAYIGSGFNGNAVAALRIGPEENLRADGRDRLAWLTPTPYPVVGAVTLAGDLVLAGCGNGNYIFAASSPAGLVLALDRVSGKILWQKEMPDTVLAPIAACDRLAVCAVRNGEIVALDLSDNGAEVWRSRVRGDATALAGVALTSSHVYAVSSDGYLTIMSAADGEILESHYINRKEAPGEMGLTLSSPLVAGGRVYVGSETGGLRAFVGTRPDRQQ